MASCASIARFGEINGMTVAMATGSAPVGIAAAGNLGEATLTTSEGLTVDLSQTGRPAPLLLEPTKSDHDSNDAFGGCRTRACAADEGI